MTYISWCYVIKKYIKHFFRIDIQFIYQHSWKLGKLEIVRKHSAIFVQYKTFSVLIYGKTLIVFSHNFEFSQFRRVLIEPYVNTEKKFYNLFYNIARRNIKKEIFRVDIELYQHGS
jgi:hypothetical protein